LIQPGQFLVGDEYEFSAKVTTYTDTVWDYYRNKVGFPGPPKTKKKHRFVWGLPAQGLNNFWFKVTGVVTYRDEARMEFRGRGSLPKMKLENICMRKIASATPETVAAVSAPPPQTAVTEPVAQGVQRLPVATQMGFEIGDEIVLDAGTPIEEQNQIADFGSLILEFPLKYEHPAGAVVEPPVEESQANDPFGNLEEDDAEDSITTTEIATTTPPGGTVVDGETASLDALGFLAVTSMCCPWQMEVFFTRLLDKMGLYSCSKPHLQGLMHWFHCVPNMDFQYVVDVINNGNPCKYWQFKGMECPSLTPECQGHWCR